MTVPWMVSLHGGHSGGYCEHAKDSLDEMLDQAWKSGYRVFGVSEHVPRQDPWHYRTEIDKGWTSTIMVEKFREYSTHMDRAIPQWQDRMTVLKGLEIEVVPDATWLEDMTRLRTEGNFDYVVGSVHYVHDIPIDETPENFTRAIERSGSMEQLALDYYDLVLDMAEKLKPEVLGHPDLIRKLGDDFGYEETPAVRQRLERLAALAHRHGCLFDVNTYPLRKGKPNPYCSPFILSLARQEGVGLCFGDDSHSIDTVGAGLPEARRYLLEHGIEELSFLNRVDGEVRQDSVPL